MSQRDWAHSTEGAPWNYLYANMTTSSPTSKTDDVPRGSQIALPGKCEKWGRKPILGSYAFFSLDSGSTK
jgi:hypothetical protein